MSPSRRSKKGKVEAKDKENVPKTDIANEEEQVELTNADRSTEATQTTQNPEPDCANKEESHENGPNLKRLHSLQTPETPCKKSHVEVELVESQTGLDAEFGFTRSVAVKVVSVPRVDSKYEDDFHVAFAPELVVSEESSVGSVDTPHTVGETDTCSSETLTSLGMPSKLNEPKLFLAGDSALFAGTDAMKVVCSTPVTINFVPSLESVAEEDTSSSATVAGTAEADGVDGDSSTQQESDAHIGSDRTPSECGVDEKKHVLPTYVATTVQNRLQPVVLRLRHEERAFKEFSPRLHTMAKYILIVWTAPFVVWFAFMSIPLVISLVFAAMFSGFELSWKSATDAYSEFKELLD